jgi:hypothetical protein
MRYLLRVDFWACTATVVVRSFVIVEDVQG